MVAIFIGVLVLIVWISFRSAALHPHCNALKHFVEFTPLSHLTQYFVSQLVIQ